MRAKGHSSETRRLQAKIRLSPSHLESRRRTFGRIFTRAARVCRASIIAPAWESAAWAMGGLSGPDASQERWDGRSGVFRALASGAGGGRAQWLEMFTSTRGLRGSSSLAAAVRLQEPECRQPVPVFRLWVHSPCASAPGSSAGWSIMHTLSIPIRHERLGHRRPGRHGGRCRSNLHESDARRVEEVGTMRSGSVVAGCNELATSRPNRFTTWPRSFTDQGSRPCSKPWTVAFGPRPPIVPRTPSSGAGDVRPRRDPDS